MTDPAAPDETLHVWRIVAACFDGVDEARYECDLCGDTLIVPAGAFIRQSADVRRPIPETPVGDLRHNHQGTPR